MYEVFPRKSGQMPSVFFLMPSVTEKRKRITAKASSSLTDQGQFVTDGLRLEEGSTGLYQATALPWTAGGTRQLTEPQLRQKEPLATENWRVWETEQDEESQMG